MKMGITKLEILFGFKDLILPLGFPTELWHTVGILLCEITRTLGTSQTEEGQEKESQEGSGRGVCHFT